MKKDPFIALLSAKLSGEISPEEQHELNEMLQKNEAYRQLARQLEQYFKNNHAAAVPEAAIHDIWARISRAEEQGPEENSGDSQPFWRRFNRRYSRIAAAVIMLLNLSVLSYYLIYRPQDITILTADTDKVFKVLDDGTGIWLNKKSILTYNKDFGKHKREIFLKGEAFFDVAKNVKVPLVIHAGAADIEVRGTAFNVNAYKENENVEIALVRGVITVSSRQQERKAIVLKPHDKLILSSKMDNAMSHIQLMHLSSDKLLLETHWMADTLVFNKERLEDLVLKMEKKYDLKIEIHSEKLKEKRFSGTFIHETIHQALAALKLSYPLTYTIHNRLVILKEQE